MGPLPALALAMAMLAGPSAAAAGGDAGYRSVSVRLHDYAHLLPCDLTQVQREVSAIYATIGVVIDWRAAVRPDEVESGVMPWPGDPSPELSVLIMSVAMASAIGLPGDVAGYAAVKTEGGGRVAFAVADRSRDIADLARVSLPHVLVGVIAHELAHLLMPRRGHSPSGILHARWRPDEFRVLPRHPFTGEEATEIRRSVAAMSGTAAHADN